VVGGGGEVGIIRLCVFDHSVEILQLLCDRVAVPYLLHSLSFCFGNS
jgi:hypothetical protein